MFNRRGKSGDPVTTAANPATPAPLQRRSFSGKRLSVIAPAYNEQAVIDQFFVRLEAALSGCVDDYEVILVNDGSKDATLAVALAHQQRNPKVRVINLSRNFGKELALTAGLDAASGDAVVPIDVDLQDPPELIGEFIACWEAGYDVAYGARADRSTDTAVKRFTAQTFYSLFNRLSHTPMPYNAGDFRLMDRRVVDVLKALPERNRFMKGLFAWVGFSQIAVPYSRPERAAGLTSWRYWRLWNFALDGLTAFSSLPIRIWTYVGMAAGVAAWAYAGFLVLRTLIEGRDVPGYASLMVAILMAFGVQMFAIGLLGEYVARIYQEVKARPRYVIADQFGFADVVAPRESAAVIDAADLFAAQPRAEVS